MPALRPVNVQDFSGPKRGRSGYFIFGDEIRSEVTAKERKVAEKKGEKVSVADVAKKIGEEWKKVSADKKSKYEATAAKEAAEYKKLREKWEKTAEFQKWKNASADYKKQKSDKKARAEVKASGMPKRPAQPIMLFSSSIRDQISELTKKFDNDKRERMSQRQKVAKEKWDALTDAKKKQWKTKHDQAKAKYEEEMAKFKETDEYKTFQENLAKSKKRHMTATREDTEEPAAKKQKVVSAMKSKDSVATAMKSKTSIVSAMKSKTTAVVSAMKSKGSTVSAMKSKGSNVSAMKSKTTAAVSAMKSKGSTVSAMKSKASTVTKTKTKSKA